MNDTLKSVLAEDLRLASQFVSLPLERNEEWDNVRKQAVDLLNKVISAVDEMQYESDYEQLRTIYGLWAERVRRYWPQSGVPPQFPQIGTCLPRDRIINEILKMVEITPELGTLLLHALIRAEEKSNVNHLWQGRPSHTNVAIAEIASSKRECSWKGDSDD